MKKIIIRTDASVEIGSGHVMRCLTVAKYLQEYDCKVKFFMKQLPGNLIDYVKEEGFVNITQIEKADLYIIDHYGIDEVWEKQVRPFTKKIAVIDDLANRRHDCDLLMDQNVVPNFEMRYENLVPKNCVKLLGPGYLIMRDEFIEARKHLRDRNGEIKRLLVFMGGTDPTNETMKVLQALDEFSFAHIDIVVGNGNVQKDNIHLICKEKGYNYHCQINYLAQLMQLADFSIGAGGTTTWERCYVGLPSSCTIVADNQIVSTKFAAKLGAIINLGWHEQVTVDTYKQLLKDLKIEGLSEKGIQLTENKQPNAWVHKILELIK
ncbi:pseudaminic acid biosynthesis protein PseG [Ureibacillus massiliensis 4400831 = CIP 108448 = CCUG 49529]|uniref:Pseudaminic acid biosynthesis protein PseG n=1 Tax=Ureibacillus massiliensis 4400831 = CIP 108448 = CCUG 49529 TaxID=1211035 RepID=A0A0A3IZE9_9BACL|nr:UDP-2,4-diacetamido-2,4,6-trideoxy-beta-L-altropyranose hydrolase [Ureibacillus massiliensis]KGR90101.1 pseudaminic acid biosynthesis protein PseG [Ureibacillus massiliensis 4400831 = CIP 108448 = CCUG 49529]